MAQQPEGSGKSSGRPAWEFEENVAAVDVELTAADSERIESVFPKGATAGARYADMSTVGG